jgi:large subunit ribosomal protein L1
MGTTKIKTVDMSKTAEKPAKRDTKKKEPVDIQKKIDEKVKKNLETEVKKAAKTRSKTYITARRHVDRTKLYPLKKAVNLVTKTSYSKFAGTVTADLTVKDANLNLETTFPHSTGKTVKVAIATDALLKKIEKGDIDFDILLASPDMMGKIAKHARTLGPKGLMPNPKNKTVTDNPEKRQKELEGGKMRVKTEKKNPLMHVSIGKTDHPEKQLIDNIEHLIHIVGPKKVKKLTLSATMSPGIKVDLSEYQTA